MTDVRFSIALPREAYTVNVARRVIEEALRANGVCEDCLSDLLIAGSEACANVIEHGADALSYEVSARLHEGTCVLQVVNTGPAFDPGPASAVLPDLDAESGRGLILMSALVDQVTFGRNADDATVVRLDKRLHPGEPVPHQRCGDDTFAVTRLR